MITHTDASPASELEEIIDGVMDADISDKEKEELLTRIRKEGGVFSEGLREALIRVFDGQVASELTKQDEYAALAGASVTETVSPEEVAEAEEVVASTMAEGEKALNAIRNIALKMQSDIRVMEHDILEDEQEIRAAEEQKRIDQIRNDLGTPGALAA